MRREDKERVESRVKDVWNFVCRTGNGIIPRLIEDMGDNTLSEEETVRHLTQQVLEYAKNRLARKDKAAEPTRRIRRG